MTKNIDKNSLSTLIPSTFAYQFQIVPIQLDNDTLNVGMIEPQNIQCLDDLEFLTGKTIVPIPMIREKIESLQFELYGTREQEDYQKTVDTESLRLLKKSNHPRHKSANH